MAQIVRQLNQMARAFKMNHVVKKNGLSDDNEQQKTAGNRSSKRVRPQLYSRRRF